MKNSAARKIGKNILLAAIVILLVISIATAVKGGEGWRETWDFLWSWINFLILFTLVYWFLWPFMMKMLDGRIQGISDEVGSFEKEKAQIENEIKDIENNLAQSNAKYEQYKTKMQAEIKIKQDHIIQTAKREANAMFEQAKEQRKAILVEAQKDLKAELIDMAVNNALAKLPQVISDKDQQKLFENFYNRAFTPPKGA